MYWTVLLLGLWTMLAPITFGYDETIAVPMGWRELASRSSFEDGNRPRAFGRMEPGTGSFWTRDV